jgi:hypothetical protein
MWMTTNIKVVDGGYTWRFNIDVCEELFRAFLDKDYFPLLMDPPGCTINLVRASRNPLWLPADIDFLTKAEQDSGRVKLRTLEGGHWLHVDNPEGLWNMISLNSFESR